MARKHISQREAVRLRRRVKELERLLCLRERGLPFDGGMHIGATHEALDAVLGRFLDLQHRYAGDLIADLKARGHSTNRDLVFELGCWWIDRDLCSDIFEEISRYGYDRLPTRAGDAIL